MFGCLEMIRSSSNHPFLQVVGIEMNASAVSDAQRNAEINGIKNCRFICGKVRLDYHHYWCSHFFSLLYCNVGLSSDLCRTWFTYLVTTSGFRSHFILLAFGHCHETMQ